MRKHRLFAAIVGGLVASVVLAQGTDPKPSMKGLLPGEPAKAVTPEERAKEARLDEVLKAWEAKLKTLETFASATSRVETDQNKQNSELKGRVLFEKPNRAKSEMVNKDNPKEFEIFLSTGKEMYQYIPASKVVRKWEAKGPIDRNENTMLNFLLGMRVEDIKRRYKLTLEKETEWYAYVTILPREERDMQDFTAAQMVLFLQPSKTAYMPARFWFRHPNKSETAWAFSEPMGNPRIDAKEFQFPGLPKDWKLQDVPTEPAPKNKNEIVPTTKVRP